MYVFPAKTLNIYNIDGKEITIIGEVHQKYEPVKVTNTMTTWDYMLLQQKNGKVLNLELPEWFKDHMEFFKAIHSINISNVFKGTKNLKEIRGIDFRRNFFKHFKDFNVQSYVFNETYSKLVAVETNKFMKMVYDFLIYTNKFMRENALKFSKLNENIVKDLQPIHMKADKHWNMLQKDIASSKTPLTTLNDLYKYSKYFRTYKKEIFISFKDFILFMGDLMTLNSIMYHPNKKHVVLLGNAHALNLNRYLKKYSVFSNGKEVESNKISVKGLDKF